MKEKQSTDKEAILKAIKELHKDKLTLFESNPQYNAKDMMLLPLGTYKEAMDLILYLLKTCIMALQSDYTADKYIGEPEICTNEVLKLVTQLMPYQEMEFLDDLNAMLKQL